MTVVRVLVVDDEAPARAKVRKLLDAEDGFAVVGEAADGEEAVRAIRDVKPDLVLLDIRMPRMDGFQVVETVGVEAMPLVVFVTAFDEHALKAFEVHALDYLLKPFAAGRLREVLGRARERLAKDAAASLAQRLEGLLRTLEPAADEASYATRVRVRRAEDREVLLPVREIDFVRSQGNYLDFHAGGEVYRRRGTLSTLAERLDPEHFARINRSELVRLDAVGELQPFFHGDTYVVLKDGTRLTWSRRFRDRMPDL